MRATPVAAMLLGGCGAALIACASAPATKATSGLPSSAPSADPLASSPERQEIAKLDAEIDAELARRNQPPAPTPPCAGMGCVGAAATAVEMGVGPRVEGDPKVCKPAPSDTCKDSCTLSNSICTNAGRICELAKKLGDNDAWANEKCAKGTDSCKQSEQRCCSCL
ncbi:MAG: hypothetical protein IPQ07_01585 [Myxococcales bacterium]|nr:hypothetical protein [Myxococcales bacterium]